MGILRGRGACALWGLPRGSGGPPDGVPHGAAGWGVRPRGDAVAQAPPRGSGAGGASEGGLVASVWGRPPTTEAITGQVSGSPAGPCLQVLKRLTSSACLSIPLSPQAVPWNVLVEVSVFNSEIREEIIMMSWGMLSELKAR